MITKTLHPSDPLSRCIKALDAVDAEVEAAVKRYEPELAVFSVADGLALIEQLLTDTLNHLRAGGILCLEHGHRQARDVHLMASDLGWQAIKTYQDLAGRDRVTRMQKL